MWAELGTVTEVCANLSLPGMKLPLRMETEQRLYPLLGPLRPNTHDCIQGNMHFVKPAMSCDPLNPWSRLYHSVARDCRQATHLAGMETF